MSVKIFGFLLLSMVMFSAAGERQLTGNFARDILTFTPDTVTAETSIVVRDPRQREPLASALYSLVLPGAGQLHAERYTKAAIFFGVELALIAYAVINENNGDDKTTEIKRYAEAHWSAERYAKWINTYGAGDYGPAASIDLNRVRNNDFSEINAWESAPSANKVGFSHQLPRFGEQQYYELIGKYYQFKFGWDTYPADMNGVPQSDGRDYFNNFTANQQIKEYAAERGKANDYYYAASFALSALVINHVISAFDAFYSANNFNKELSATLHISPSEGIDGGMMSQLRVNIGF